MCRIARPCQRKRPFCKREFFLDHSKDSVREKTLQNVTASRRNVHFCTTLSGKRPLGQERIFFAKKKTLILLKRKIFFYQKKEYFGEGSETGDLASSLANLN